METLKCIETRRSIRKFKSDKIDHATMEAIVKAASFAPSWKNTQTSRYYVAMGDAKKDFSEKCLPTFNRNNTENADIIDHFRIGLFHNQTLVAWAEACDMPEHFLGFEEYDCYVIPPMELRMTAGDTLCCAAVITDIHGREVVCSGIPVTLNADGLSLTWAEGFSISPSSNEGWIYH